LAAQRLTGIDRERMELQTWYAEKGQMLLDGYAAEQEIRAAADENYVENETERQEVLTNLNNNFRLKNAAINKKYGDIEVAKAAADAKAIQAINKAKRDTIAATLGSIASTLEFVAQQNSEFAGIYKATAIAETAISTYSAAQSQYAAASKLPPPAGIVLPPIVAAAAIAQGLVRVAQIKAQKFSGGGHAKGDRDTIPAMLTPGEFVATGQQQRNMLDFANGRGGQGGIHNQIEINIANGDAATVTEAVKGALADTYQERIQQFSEMEHEVSVLEVGTGTG